jgi:hypothetical protein
VHQELAFAEVANEAIAKGPLDFFIFGHPLLADELSVLHESKAAETKR